MPRAVPLPQHYNSQRAPRLSPSPGTTAPSMPCAVPLPRHYSCQHASHRAARHAGPREGGAVVRARRLPRGALSAVPGAGEAPAVCDASLQQCGQARPPYSARSPAVVPRAGGQEGSGRRRSAEGRSEQLRRRRLPALHAPRGGPGASSSSSSSCRCCCCLRCRGAAGRGARLPRGVAGRRRWTMTSR